MTPAGTWHWHAHDARKGRHYQPRTRLSLGGWRHGTGTHMTPVGTNPARERGGASPAAQARGLRRVGASLPTTVSNGVHWVGMIPICCSIPRLSNWSHCSAILLL